MFARVSTIIGKSEHLENGISSFREQVIPAARKMTGFKGAILMVDRKSGKSVGVTLWDSEKDLQSSTQAADKLRAQSSQAMSAAKPPVVEIFEVAVQAQN